MPGSRSYAMSLYELQHRLVATATATGTTEFRWELEFQVDPEGRGFRRTEYGRGCRSRDADHVLQLANLLTFTVMEAAAALSEGCCPLHREQPYPLNEIIEPVVLERAGDWGWCRSCHLLYRLGPGTVLPTKSAIFVRRRQPEVPDAR